MLNGNLRGKLSSPAGSSRTPAKEVPKRAIKRTSGSRGEGGGGGTSAAFCACLAGTSHSDRRQRGRSPSPPASVLVGRRSVSSRGSSSSCSSSVAAPSHSRADVHVPPKCMDSAYCRLLTENTTFHGIRDSFQAAGCLRALWICIIVLASLAALVGCGLIVWEFNTRPLSVTYSIKENGSLFVPDIVVCPFNRFNRSFLHSLNISEQLAQYLELAFPQSSQHPFQYKSYKGLLERMDLMDAELSELLQSSGLTFSEFIKRSAISCPAFFLSKSVCQSAQEIMTMSGKCFRIPGEEQRNAGHGHAQRLIVRLPNGLYNPAPNQMLNDGILVKLAERGKGIDHDMSFVPAGVHAIFPLTATQFVFKHYPPHFLCREQEDPTYSRVWCFETCFMERAERQCNCSLAAAARPGTPRTCTPRQFFNCVYSVLRFDDPNLMEQEVTRCKALCWPPCVNWRFDKTVTYAHFPSQMARHFVDDNDKWDELKNTVCWVARPPFPFSQSALHGNQSISYHSGLLLHHTGLHGYPADPDHHALIFCGSTRRPNFPLDWRLHNLGDPAGHLLVHRDVRLFAGQKQARKLEGKPPPLAE